MTEQEREKYPEIAKVHDLKEKYGEDVIQHVQSAIDYIFNNQELYICEVDDEDRFYPTYTSAEQITYEYWGIDYKKFKKEWGERLHELLNR